MYSFWILEKELPEGHVGFTMWGLEHIAFLLASALLIVLFTVVYRKLSPKGRSFLRVSVGSLILLLELVPDVWLFCRGKLDIGLLPLHLCGLAVFFTFAHSVRPGKTLGNFLYSTCMPGALLALLFANWTMYPPLAMMSVRAFLIHALLVAYPLMLLAGGDIVRDYRKLSGCFLILLGLAVPIYFFDRHFRVNYMFLLEPSPGSPLEWAASVLGVPGYTAVFVPATALVWAALYLPGSRKRRRKEKEA